MGCLRAGEGVGGPAPAIKRLRMAVAQGRRSGQAAPGGAAGRNVTRHSPACKHAAARLACTVFHRKRRERPGGCTQGRRAAAAQLSTVPGRPAARLLSCLQPSHPAYLPAACSSRKKSTRSWLDRKCCPCTRCALQQAIGCECRPAPSTPGGGPGQLGGSQGPLRTAVGLRRGAAPANGSTGGAGLPLLLAAAAGGGSRRLATGARRHACWTTLGRDAADPWLQAGRPVVLQAAAIECCSLREAAGLARCRWDQSCSAAGRGGLAPRGPPSAAAAARRILSAAVERGGSMAQEDSFLLPLTQPWCQAKAHSAAQVCSLLACSLSPPLAPNLLPLAPTPACQVN